MRQCFQSRIQKLCEHEIFIENNRKFQKNLGREGGLEQDYGILEIPR